jgi:hypothetical protein
MMATAGGPKQLTQSSALTAINRLAAASSRVTPLTLKLLGKRMAAACSHRAQLGRNLLERIAALGLGGTLVPRRAA